MATNSISFGSLHARCNPVWALGTCGEPNETTEPREYPPEKYTRSFMLASRSNLKPSKERGAVVVVVVVVLVVVVDVVVTSGQTARQTRRADESVGEDPEFVLW